MDTFYKATSHTENFHENTFYIDINLHANNFHTNIFHEEPMCQRPFKNDPDF